MSTVSLGGLMTYPIHPASWQRPSGNVGYRITNHFDGPDYVNGGVHQATDIGNFRKGDPVRMPTGAERARAVRDVAGTLGVEIDFGHGLTVTAWHLDKVNVPSQWTAFSAGSLLGITGNSPGSYRAPDGAVRTMPQHTHLEGRRNGVKFDLEPYLLGQPLPLEVDMNTPSGGRALVAGIVGPGNRLRVDQNTAEGSEILGVTIGDPDQPREVQVLLSGVTGEPYTLGGKRGDEYLWIGTFGRTWYVAAPLVTNLRLKGDGEQLATDCTVLENKIERARTAIAGAVQALDVARGAVA